MNNIINVEEIQRQIDATDYWDSKIFDVKSSYFGDQVLIFMECDEEFLWEFKFEICNEVKYQTDASKRKKNLLIKNQNLKQLGYYGQSFIVSKSSVSPFIHFDINLSSLNIIIECLCFSVSKLPKQEQNFWWSLNG